MLSNEQVNFLCDYAGIHKKVQYGLVTGVWPLGKAKTIAIPYEDFKKEMSLSDMRFHFLLGKKNYLAGGSVLDWINGDKVHNDYDMFFENYGESAVAMKSILESLGLKSVGSSGYAESFVSPEDNTIIQLVYFISGHIEDILSGFDMSICSFAIGSDSIYTTDKAIYDLATRRIAKQTAVTGSTNDIRMVKYYKRNYYFNME